MAAYVRYVEGLLVAHAYLALAFAVGSSVFPWCEKRTKIVSPAYSTVSFVVITALGLAVLGFCCFALAAFGLFRPIFMVLLIACVFAVSGLLYRTSPLRAEYWKARLQALYSCCGVPQVVVYYILIFLAFPAVNLANLGSDGLLYHLAYAVDWVRSGHLMVDPFLREPFDASNVTLLYSLLLMAGGGAFISFLTWSAALLTGLGIASGIEASMSHWRERRWIAIGAGALAVAVVASPAYFRWLDTAYLDAFLGMFALAGVLALRQFWSDRENPGWIIVAGILFAFLIGSKSSFLPFVVILGAAVSFSAWRAGLSRRFVWLPLVLLVALSAPWYVRNVIDAGDPVPPVLNILLYGHDGLISRTEANQIIADISTSKTPAAAALLPFRAFFQADDPNNFREYGETALIMLLYAPFIALLIGVYRQKTYKIAVTVPILILLSFVGYWWATTSLLRYAILFYPLLALCCGLIVAPLAPRFHRYGAIAFAAICVASIISSPGSRAYYYHVWASDFRGFPASYSDDDTILAARVAGYSDQAFVSTFLRSHNIQGRLYAIAPPLNYYYRLHGITSIGDWVGPAGFDRLYDALDAGEVDGFMKGLNVSAVLIDPTKVIGGLGVPLARRLEGDGYCHVPIPASNSLFLVRGLSACS